MATLARLELELVTSLAKFQQDMGRAAAVAEKTAKRIESTMKGVGGALAGIGAGMAFKAIIDEAGEAEQALKQLQQTIRSTGGVAGVTVNQVTAISSEIQKLTGVSDDAVNSMSSVLLTFTKVGKEVFPEATKAIVDLSAKLGQDMKASAVQVGKALNDPIKGVTALQRVGVSFTESQKAQIKALVESGNTLQAQKVILRELQTEFGGAAAAARDSLKGALDALSVSAKDVLENIGASAGQGLRGGIEVLIQVCELGAAHGKELALAMQGIAASLGTVIALKAFGEFQKIGAAIVTLGATNAAFVVGLAAVVGALVAFRNEQATLLGTTKTWGEVVSGVFNFVAQVGRATINSIIDVMVFLGRAFAEGSKIVGDSLKSMADAVGAGAAFKGITDNLKKIGHWQPSKGLLEWAEQANQASAKAGTDWTGNFFKPLTKLADDAKKRMEDIGKAARAGGTNKIVTGDMPDVESKAAKKAREAAEKAAKKAKEQHDQDIKSVDQLIASMKQVNDETTLRLNKNKEMIPELEAQNKLAKLAHLTEKERVAATAQINKLAAERRELEKQVAIKEEGEKLAEMLESYKTRTQEIKNAANGQNELNVTLKAQQEIEKLIKVGKGENLELQKQILAVAKEQEAVLREQKRLEALTKYGEQVQDLEDQNRQMALKVSGQEAFLPLLEQEKKIREIMKDQNLSDQDKSQLIGQIQQQATQTVRYNQVLEEQDRVLKMIKDSSAGTTQKIAALQMAFASGRVNVKQYGDALQDLHKEGMEKLKKDAKEFSDVFVGAIDKAFDKGSKLGTVFKELGRDVLKMGLKKIAAPAIENIFTSISSKLFGGAYGINQQNPNGLPGVPGLGGMGGGGVTGGAVAAMPTTLTEGPAIVSLLQQILIALGGTPMGTPLGGLGVPMMPPTMLNYGQTGGGGIPLMARLAGMFGKPGMSFYNGAVNAPSDAMGYGGMAFGAGRLMGGLGGAMGSLLRGILPGFAGGGFLMPGQWGIAGERGPELIYGGGGGMGIMSNAMSFGGRGAVGPASIPYRGSFTFGAGGVTGDGKISFQDHIQLQAQLSKQLYEAAYAKAQRGEFPMGWQLENMRAQMNLDAQQAASGQSSSFFTRPEFEPQWQHYNESIINLRAMGGNFDLESYFSTANLPSLSGQNTGQRWGGFQATPVGTAFGGGDGGGDAWGTAMPYMGPATSNFQRGSSFAGGGYNPILGPHTPGASAFSTPWNAGGGAVLGGPGGIRDLAFGGGVPIRPFTNSPISTGAYNTRPSDTTMRYAGDGRYSPDPTGRVNPIFDRDPYYGQPMYKGGGTVLPWQLADMVPVSVQSTAKNIFDAFNIVNAGNPSQFTARGIGQNMLGQAAGAMLGGITHPNSMFSQMGAIMSQPWANRNMPASAYPAAMSLFGMRGMKHGGRPRRGEPIAVGEAGMELFVPETNGRIVPHSKIADGIGGGGGGGVTVNTYTSAPLKVKKQQKGRDMILTLEDLMDSVVQRGGGFTRQARNQFGLQPLPVGRS